MKLLVNSPGGQQELIEVGEGGGYFDSSRVLWDEREDGPLPEITLGGMRRAGSSLVFDADLMAAYEAEQRRLAMPALSDYTDALDDLLDAVAASKGYGGKLIAPTISLASYDNDPNPVFAAQATAFKAYRSAIWTMCYSIMAQVYGGQIPQPTVDELVAMMPPMEWPA